MSGLARLIQSSQAINAQALLAQFAAGSQGAARSAWIEINRPLTALGLTPTQADASITAKLGNVTIGPISLPIGMDIKSITCAAQDVDRGWLMTNFTFGTLNLVNPQGSLFGVNLSMFDPRLQHVDRLAPWILSKTKVDVQVTATLFNAVFQYDMATPPVGAYVACAFHGFSLNAFQEEQVCAIQTRVEPTDRNVGVADLIHVQRTTLGAGLNLAMPAHYQPPIQGGRSPMAAPVYAPIAAHPAQPQLAGNRPLY